MTEMRIPTSIEGIKRLAKRIADEKSIQHTAALEEAAKIAGFQNFLHAKRSVSTSSAAPKSDAPGPAPEGFLDKARAKWVRAIARIDPALTRSISWTERTDILQVLQHVVGEQADNHAHLPRGGGLDIMSVKPSWEAGCIELGLSVMHKLVAKPKRLLLERIEADPAQSFLMLELDALEPTGIYEAYDQRLREARQERVADVGGRYKSVELIQEDVDFMTPEARPLARNPMAVTRLLDGKIMFVTKGSYWNHTPATYSGQHGQWPVADIRLAIEAIATKQKAI